ncbi:Titin, partial [Orchesella cincta]
TSNALLYSSKGTVNQKYSNWSNCPFHLSLKVEGGHVILYKWDKINESQEIETRAILTNESTHFENVFRLHSITKEANCVRLLNETDSCPNCFLAEENNYTVNAIVFYAKYRTEVLVFKECSVCRKKRCIERRFYWYWKLSPSVLAEEMVQFEVPPVIYTNLKFDVICRVSVFLFAYGTIITHHLSADKEEAMPTEYLTPFGYRQVERSMAFNATGDKNISCFSPLKKSKDWITKTQMVQVEDAFPPSIDNFTENKTELVTILPNQVSQSLHADCNFSGNPLPSLKWIFPMKNLTGKVNVIHGTNFSRIVFPKWDHDLAGTYVVKLETLLDSHLKR